MNTAGSEFAQMECEYIECECECECDPPKPEVRRRESAAQPGCLRLIPLEPSRVNNR